MATLSVCMIAKNESEVLGRCLDCVKSFADEIVVVDTGSTDNTKDIAARYTDKVFDFEWIDDFAAARNFSFSKATKDYVMWLDCDDIIDEANQRLINEFKLSLSNYACDAFLAHYCYAPSRSITVTRIVKRGSCQWEGFVHEYLATKSNRKLLDFTITHNKPASSLERDTGRNLKIFKKKLKEKVEFTTRDILYFAKELYWNADYTNALRWLDKYFKQTDTWVEDCIEATKIKADVLGKLGRGDEMIDVLAQGIVKYGMNKTLLYDCGFALYNAKKYREASMYFLAIVNGLGVDSMYFTDVKDYTYLSLVWLSCCYWYNGEKLTGKRFHEIAKAMRPDSPTIINNEKFFGKV